MKYKFNVQIRGNVEYANQAALQSAITEKLAGVTGFTLISRSVEVWQENGVARLFDGLQRFTIGLSGNILADSDTAVEAIIAGFCNAYPEFTLTFQDITAWQDGSGSWRLFNDDGTEYFEPAPVTEVEETSKEAVEVEEVTA